MAMPSFSPFLKTPINRPKRKEKIRFTFPAADAAEEVDVDLEEDKVDYVASIYQRFNHLEPAFKRANDEHIEDDPLMFIEFDDDNEFQIIAIN